MSANDSIINASLLIEGNEKIESVSPYWIVDYQLIDFIIRYRMGKKGVYIEGNL